jgi:hypothetical protein
MEIFPAILLAEWLGKVPSMSEIVELENARLAGEFRLAHGPKQQEIISLTIDGKRALALLANGETLPLTPSRLCDELWRVDESWEPQTLGPKDSQMVGTAGVYYVMSQLAFRGFHAAATHGNAPYLDILVASPDGATALSLQVKTTAWAERTRGRGGARVPYELQWPLGHKAARHQSDNLFFAFVDLKDFGGAGKPDVYIVPSRFVRTYCAEWVDTVKMVRFHVPIATMKPFKEGWHLLTEALAANPDP